MVVEVNQMLFNQADPWFKSLHPAVAALGGSLLTPSDRGLLKPYSVAAPAGIMNLVNRYVLAYSMRSDIRDLLANNDTQKAAVPNVNADDLIGTYDLDPLTEQNVGVHFLDETVKALTGAGIPVIAIMTPTNHVLMHEYIDVPEYDANVKYVANVLKGDGARVINLDRAFAADEFVDNDHLNQKGQQHLSSILSGDIGIR